MLKKWTSWSISIKWTFAFAFLILLVSGSMTIGVMFQLSAMQRQGLQERFYDIANFSIPLVDGDYHSLIRNGDDEESPFYNVIAVRLQTIQDTSKIIKRIYTLRINDDGHLIYIVDASEDTENHFGTIYQQDNPELVADLTLIDMPYITDDIQTDTSGNFLSGYAPIYDQFGELDGYLGIDIDTSSVQSNESRIQRTAYLVFLAIVPFALFIGWRIAQFFTSPINDLVKGAEKVSQGNLNFIVPVRSKDELGVLANMFNQMTSQLQHTLLGLEEEIEKYQKAEKVQDVIFRISQAVSSTESIDDMYHSIHNILGELIPVDNFFIALFDENTNTIGFPYYIDQYDKPPLKRKLTNGLTEYVMGLGKPLLVNTEQLKNLAAKDKILLGKSIPVDWLGAPLIVEGRTLGVIAVQSYSNDIRINQDNLSLLEFISTQIALAIEHKTAAEMLQKSNERYRLLFENSPISLWEEDFSVVKQITDDLRNQGVKDFRTYLTDNPDIVHQCASEVRILDVNNATLELFGATSKEEMFSNLTKIFVDESYEIFKEEIVNIANGITEFNWEGINQTLQGKRIDISIRWSVVPGHENDLSKIIISMIDITKRLMTEKKLLYISSHDALTGLYNRAYFDEEMTRLDHSRQFPISVIMVDVDNLKSINDTQGHLAGDKMLQRAASVLNKVFRSEDVVARIGGDEFAVLLPNIDEVGAARTVERIQENIQRENEIPSGKPLSLSLGVSTAKEAGKLSTTIIEADTNMYLDKASNRKSRRSTKIKTK
ncbi:MAG: diguanylate cyclase [Anaerolineaceae bacterium]|nr:diguanylate cyclase [Anaerolineaceae bacterium]